MLKVGSKRVGQALIGLLLALGVSVTSVQALPAASGITVSPGQLQFILSKDSPSQTIPITVTNNYDTDITMDASFKGIDENAGLLVAAGKPEARLRPALHVSDPSFMILAHRQRIIQVTVDNLTALTPGGHYASLLLTQRTGNDRQLTVRAGLSLTMFTTKEQGAVRRLSVSRFHTNGWLFHLPSAADLTFQNTGNVYVVPRASVTVLARDATTEYAHGVANIQSFPLLQGKQLVSHAPLTHLKTVWLPQRLILVASYRPDGGDMPISLSRTIWYIPPVYLFLLLPLAWPLWRRRRRFAARLREVDASPVLVPIKTALRSYRQVTVRAEASTTPVTVRIDTPTVTTKRPSARKPTAKRPARKKQATKRVTRKADSNEPAVVEPAIPLLISLADLAKRTTKVTPRKKTAEPARTPSSKAPSKAADRQSTSSDRTTRSKPAAKPKKRPIKTDSEA